MSMLIDTRPPPVEHRLLGMDRRKMLPALLVLALVIFWGGVVPAIDEAVAADEIEAGTVFDLNLGATFAPAAGWVVDGVPAPSAPALGIYDDGVKFTISVGEFEGSPELLLETIRDLRDDFEIEGDQHALATTSGIPGVAIEIVGADFDGALFAFVAVPPEGVTLKRGVPSSIGIQVVVEGPPESLTNRVGEIGQMLASIQVDFSGSGQEEGS